MIANQPLFYSYKGVLAIVPFSQANALGSEQLGAVTNRTVSL